MAPGATARAVVSHSKAYELREIVMYSDIAIQSMACAWSVHDARWYGVQSPPLERAVCT